MQTSDFITPNKITFYSMFDKFTALNESGEISHTYIVTSQGKSYFAKRLRPEYQSNAFFKATFQKEFELGKQISHPNIVQYESFCNDDSDCYILMEYIEGLTLDKFIAEHPDYFNNCKNLDKLFLQLLDALKCLHESDIVYSDLKPQNIMLTQVNNDLKLVDLGSCFSSAYNNTAQATKGFTSPEQDTRGKLDKTTDIYGVGKIIEYITKNSSSNIPGVYIKIMLRCLKKRKQDRIQSTDEIIKLINKHRHRIRNLIIGIISCALLFLGYKTITYNEHFNAWWDSFQIITPNINYDIEYRHTYYRILSEEDGTCEAVGHGRTPNIYLADSVSINGKEYRLTHIADCAFFQKNYIKSVYIPEGVLSIGKAAFRKCKNLTTINLPKSITYVDECAFYACENVSYMNLSPSLTQINNASFTGSSITKIEIPEGVTRIGLDAFGNSIKLIEAKLPSTLKKIERGVFWNCLSLIEITIPASVTTIGEFSFYHCNALTDIYNLAVEPQSTAPFHHNPSQITLHVPAESVEKYKKADFWKDMNIVPITN